MTNNENLSSNQSFLSAPIKHDLTFRSFGSGIGKFTIQGQIVNIFGFASHVASAVTIQFCHCGVKAAMGMGTRVEHKAGFGLGGRLMTP